MSTLEFRDFHVQATSAAENSRQFTGIGVPWETRITLWDGFSEEFAKGSVKDAENALILWRHDEPIGKVTSAKDTDKGLEITGCLSNTPRGEEAYQLLRDQVITKMSIGFEPVDVDINAEDRHYTYKTVRAREFSLVPFPAYETATITNVRQKQNERNAMPPANDQLTTTVSALTDRLEDFERQLARIETNTTPTGTRPQYRSMGEFLHKLAAGDENASEFHRAYAGGTAAEDVVKATPIGEFIKWVNARLTTINLFTRGTLPPQGNTVEYVRMETNQAKDKKIIAKQDNEGDTLAGPFKISLTDDNAVIETWGGWTELSRQRIERSQHNYLDKVLRVMGLEWARYAESRFKIYLETVLTERASDAIELPTTPDYTDYLGAILDAGDYFTTAGFAIDGLALSPELFKQLALIEAADGRPLMSVYGTGTNITGEVNLPTGSGNLAGVPTHVLWGTTGRGFFYDSSALEIDMSPGAPAQLQDESVVNLTKSFSIYGYAAMYDPFPTGILPLNYAPSTSRVGS